jgi:hypothetical protein
MENLENFRKVPDPLVSRSYRLNSLHRSPVHARDTASGDEVVTAHRWWPLPHMVPPLSPHCVEQRTVSPTSPSFPRTPATTVLCRSLPPRPHRCQLPLSVTWTQRCLPKLRLHPHGARQPHHRRPQPLPRAPIAHSPPPPFLHELTDNGRSGHLPALSIPP